jgi:hypothetical protein
MKLIVNKFDLKDEERDENNDLLIKPSHIRVYHFKPEVQIMIRALGKAEFVEPHPEHGIELTIYDND